MVRSCIRLLLLFCIFAFSSCSAINQYDSAVQKKEFSTVHSKILQTVKDHSLSDQEKIKSGEKYSVELLGVSAADVAKVVFRDVLKVPYVVAPDVYQDPLKIDLVVKNKMPADKLKKLVMNALSVSGLDVFDHDGCVYISKSKDDKGAGSGMDRIRQSKIVSVYQARGLSADKLKARISEIFKNEYKDFQIFSEPGNDYLIYKIPENENKRFRDVLLSMDRPESQVYLEVIIIENYREGLLNNGLAGYIKKVFGDLEIKISPFQTGLGVMPQLSFIGNPDLFNVTLGILQSNKLIDRVSSPYLLIKSGQNASINIGDQIPVLEKTIVNVTSTEQSIVYKSTGLNLSAKPEIIGDNIIIELTIDISQGEINKLTTINSPSISSRKIQTSLICQNSEAVLIGGIYQDRSLIANNGLPVKNKIFNDYFNDNNREKTSIELAIYLRPVIIKNKDI